MKMNEPGPWLKSCFGRLFAFAGVALALQAAPVAAVTPVPAPPIILQLDANGIDPTRATFNISTSELSIGPATFQGMNYGRFRVGSNGWRDTLAVTLNGTLSAPVVSIGNRTISFTAVNVSYFYSNLADGTALARQYGTSGDWIFTDRDGTQITFTPAAGSYDRFAAELGWAKSIVAANGMRWDFYYRS